MKNKNSFSVLNISFKNTSNKKHRSCKTLRTWHTSTCCAGVSSLQTAAEVLNIVPVTSASSFPPPSPRLQNRVLNPVLNPQTAERPTRSSAAEHIPQQSSTTAETQEIYMTSYRCVQLNISTAQWQRNPSGDDAEMTYTGMDGLPFCRVACFCVHLCAVQLQPVCTPPNSLTLLKHTYRTHISLCLCSFRSQCSNFS